MYLYKLRIMVYTLTVAQFKQIYKQIYISVYINRNVKNLSNFFKKYIYILPGKIPQ